MNNLYRSDVGFTMQDYKIANLIRMLQYKEIPFDFLNGIIIRKDTNTEVKLDNEYEYLDMHYSKLIPLWESDNINAKKYPDLYNDKKWIIGKRELKRKHQKLLILENGFKFKVGYLWKHQPFDQRPTYNINNHKKFVKNFRVIDMENNIIIENENWGAVLSQCQQYIKDNAREYYEDYSRKLIIQGYCKSENVWFEIVEFDVLKNKWLI